MSLNFGTIAHDDLLAEIFDLGSIVAGGAVTGDNANIFRDIRVCFETKLQQLSFTNIIFENQALDLESLDKGADGIEWIRGTLLPAETEAGSFGTTGQDVHKGIFQVDYYCEAGKGGFTEKLDTIANAFKRGTKLSFNNLDLHCTSVSLGAGQREDAFFGRNVDVSYFAVTAARS